MSERIIDVNIESQSRLDSQAYAIYVARMRAIPYFTDGLKPVLRRILWCLAYDYGNQGFVKTAKVVGNVIAKYNPHGDSGVEDALRNMINDFSSKYPTVDGSGAWGTKVDPYAAQPRYNECKISKFGLDVFMRDIKEDSRATDWQPNYDNKCMEPVYLPTRIPILLILGQMGIAVGVKTSIPSHNLGDVIDTTIRLMKNPNADFCLIPDECMPCEIIDTNWREIAETGAGNYIVQGIVETGTYHYQSKSGDYPCLIVRSLPDFTFYDKIEETLRKLVKSGKMPYIIDLISKSGVDKKDPTKYRFEEIIVLKKGTDPEFVKEFLYSNTGIRQTRQVRVVVIKENNLVVMNYREYLLEFINFRRILIYRRLNLKLQNLKTKIHETELYIKLLTSGEIENVIKLIRKNKSDAKSEIIEFLVNKLRVTPIQAKFLSNITLPQLSAGYLKKCQKDREKYEIEINEIINDLTNPAKIDDIIIKEMLEIKEKYNNKKLCTIIKQSDTMGIGEGIFKLVFTYDNYIKKMNENDQIPLNKLDKVNFSVVVSNTDNVILFCKNGKAFKLPVSQVQFTDPTSDGIDIRMLNKNCISPICCATGEELLKNLLENKKTRGFIFILTKNGFIKKIDIEDILTAPKSGIIYSKLESGDEVSSILFGSNMLDVLVYFKNKILRFSSKEVPYLRRSCKGNKVTLASNPGDMLGMNFLIPNTTDIIVITNFGYVNKLSIDIITKSEIRKSGLNVIKLTKGDGINTIWTCNENSKLLVRESKSAKEILVSDIPAGTTVSNGIKMFSNVSRVALLN